MDFKSKIETLISLVNAKYELGLVGEVVESEVLNESIENIDKVDVSKCFHAAEGKDDEVQYKVALIDAEDKTVLQIKGVK